MQLFVTVCSLGYVFLIRGKEHVVCESRLSHWTTEPQREARHKRRHKCNSQMIKKRLHMSYQVIHSTVFVKEVSVANFTLNIGLTHWLGSVSVTPAAVVCHWEVA